MFQVISQRGPRLRGLAEAGGRNGLHAGGLIFRNRQEQHERRREQDYDAQDGKYAFEYLFSHLSPQLSK